VGRILDRLNNPVFRALAVLGFFAIVTVVQTWPLAQSASGGLHASPDTFSGAWSLFGLSRQLISDPGHLLYGNIFYPFPNTLAVLDHQIANALMAAPLVVGGAGGVFVYNAVMLATFFLSGVFTFLLVRRMTGSVAAGLVAGCAFAFSSFRADHLPQLHLLATQWLPLALWALHRYFERPTWRRWSVFAAATLLVALSSWHIAIIGGLGVGLVALWTMADDFSQVRRRVVGLALVGILCGAALLPLALTYAEVGNMWPPATGEGRETMGTLVSLSANVVDLVGPPPPNSRTPFAPLLAPFEFRAPGIFPGPVIFVLMLPALALLFRVRASPTTMMIKLLRWWLWFTSALVIVITIAACGGAWGEPVVALLRPLAPFALFGLALAAMALVFARRAGNAEPEVALAITYAAVAAAGALLALGPRVLVGAVDVGSGLWRLDLLPLGLLIREPERLSLLLALGASVLAGIGTARVLRGFSPERRTVVAIVILVALNADLAFTMPDAYAVAPPREFETWLTELSDEGAVIDYPLDRTNLWELEASYRHGRRLVNGVGYLSPREYRQIEELPDLSPEQLAYLWEHFHPRFVVVRTDLYEPAERARLIARIESQADALRPRAQFGPDHIYELVDRGRDVALYRRWPYSEIKDKRRVLLEGFVAPGREDTIGELVLALNGHVLLEARGAEAEATSSHSVSFGPEHLVPGMNIFEIWGDYRLTGSAETHPIGTTGVRLAADVYIRSDRDRARVQVNGRWMLADKGYYLAVLDPVTGEITEVGQFNVSWYAEDSAALAAFVRAIPDGSPVVVATGFDASRQLTADAVEALRELGLQVDLRDRFQILHAAIGVKGAPPGSALEVSGESATVTLELGNPERREVQLNSFQVLR